MIRMMTSDTEHGSVHCKQAKIPAVWQGFFMGFEITQATFFFIVMDKTAATAMAV